MRENDRTDNLENENETGGDLKVRLLFKNLHSQQPDGSGSAATDKKSGGLLELAGSELVHYIGKDMYGAYVTVNSLSTGNAMQSCPTARKGSESAMFSLRAWPSSKQSQRDAKKALSLEYLPLPCTSCPYYNTYNTTLRGTLLRTASIT
jgi:hypothetical protein